MPQPKNNNNMPFLAVAVWVLLAAVCIQGYFLLQKKQPSKGVPGTPVVEPKKKQLVKPQPTPTPPAKIKGAGKIAIVIDDWGYNRTHCKNLQDIRVPLGVAILPGLPYSREVVTCATAAGKEPMLHLPMEPHSRREMYDLPYVITTGMSARDVKKIIAQNLETVPGVVGVNNHTGSKGTEDPEIMNAVLTEVKRRGLFFVDSVTSERSVCGKAADRLNMRIGRRDVFLDNKNERVMIERQFEEAAKIAQQNGHALVIGHDRVLTLQIIKEQTEKLTARGFDFIPVKEYIKRYDYSGN